ncbi:MULTISPECIES: hypothetical protein [Dermabacter]|uniref:hypothetical protein n=1 Tax=Dermabacter TaxID=36739 RepID=UPI00123737C1|nr:hypothetical protein [Dermabacter jinjuensis]MDK8804257.1 hypothetical protein [Dermabacter hominis]UEB89444.1 hypothetical protein LK448_08040 [Dermabacter jinjuensis]
MSISRTGARRTAHHAPARSFQSRHRRRAARVGAIALALSLSGIPAAPLAFAAGDSTQPSAPSASDSPTSGAELAKPDAPKCVVPGEEYFFFAGFRWVKWWIEHPGEDPCFLWHPAPEPEPEPSPDPTEEPAPEPAPTTDPTEQPAPEPEPTPEPKPTVDPTDAPLPEPEPEPSPDPTEQPTPEPAPTPEPSAEPAPQPNLEPAPAPSEAPAPAPASEPSPQPSPKPEPESEQLPTDAPAVASSPHERPESLAPDLAPEHTTESEINAGSAPAAEPPLDSPAPLLVPEQETSGLALAPAPTSQQTEIPALTVPTTEESQTAPPGVRLNPTQAPTDGSTPPADDVLGADEEKVDTILSVWTNPDGSALGTLKTILAGTVAVGVGVAGGLGALTLRARAK